MCNVPQWVIYKGSETWSNISGILCQLSSQSFCVDDIMLGHPVDQDEWCMSYVNNSLARLGEMQETGHFLSSSGRILLESHIDGILLAYSDSKKLCRFWMMDFFVDFLNKKHSFFLHCKLKRSYYRKNRGSNVRVCEPQPHSGWLKPMSGDNTVLWWQR